MRRPGDPPSKLSIAEQQKIREGFERIAGFSRPGTELTKRTLWTGLDASTLEGHMQAEGLGQLYVRLLTANFEEAVAARAENRDPAFTDEK